MIITRLTCRREDDFFFFFFPYFDSINTQRSWLSRFLFFFLKTLNIRCCHRSLSPDPLFPRYLTRCNPRIGIVDLCYVLCIILIHFRDKFIIPFLRFYSLLRFSLSFQLFFRFLIRRIEFVRSIGEMLLFFFSQKN